MFPLLSNVSCSRYHYRHNVWGCQGGFAWWYQRWTRRRNRRVFQSKANGDRRTETRSVRRSLTCGPGKFNENNRERGKLSMSKDLKSETPVRVAGIGGVFLKANDPATLAQWYTKHLGIAFQGGGDDCGTGQNFWT